MAVELDQGFDAFYLATHRRVIGQIYALTGSLPEAEDCVQEAYARAWQQWARLSTGSGQPEAWVRTVSTRLAVSSWRKAVNRRAAHRRADQVTVVPGMNPDHLAVVAALRRISADQRLAIVLHHYAGLSVDEIAVETGARPGTVKARLARGRRALAPYLAEFAQSLENPAPPHTGDQSQPSDQPQPSRREF
jgi:RNA polymerase sigma-70 factor (sigma-E family)